MFGFLQDAMGVQHSAKSLLSGTTTPTGNYFPLLTLDVGLSSRMRILGTFCGRDFAQSMDGSGARGISVGMRLKQIFLG